MIYVSIPKAAQAQIDILNFDLLETCVPLNLQAAQAFCDSNACLLQGNVEIRCPSLHLWAEHLTFNMQKEPQDGLRLSKKSTALRLHSIEAEGDLGLLQRSYFLETQKLFLEADLSKGRIYQTRLKIFQSPLLEKQLQLFNKKDASQQKSQAVILGDIHRHNAQNLSVCHAAFTTCDCPNQQPAPWLLKAQRIDIHLQDRATLWGPYLVIQPWGSWQIPITPPLLPISVPLKKRALGFLTPKIYFYGGFLKPTIDFPFFIPLGESFDITCLAGLRSDWRDPAAPFWQLSYYGAPRLGLRLRYAPWPGTTGSLKGTLTIDRKHRAAGSLDGRIPLDAREALQRLTYRYALQWKHHSHLTPSTLALWHINWLSDILYREQFILNLKDRAMPYLASRLELSHQSQLFGVEFLADSFMRIRQDPIIGDTYQSLSNSANAQSGVLHRLPAVFLHFYPYRLAWLPLYIDATFSWVNYQTLQQKANIKLPHQLQILGIQNGLSFSQRLGPFGWQWRALSDHLLLFNEGQRLIDSLLLFESSLTLPMVRFFKNIRHSIMPAMIFKTIPWHVKNPNTLFFPNSFDERLYRKKFYQLLMQCQQELRGSAGYTTTMQLQQPIDLEHMTWLQPSLSIAGQWSPYFLQLLSAWNFKQYPHNPLRELEIKTSYQNQYAEISIFYQRVASNSERFRRTIYELAALLQNTQATVAVDWTHLLSGNISLNVYQRLSLAYESSYQLPRIKDRQTTDPWQETSPNGCDNSPHGCFLNHTLSAIYASSCHCWKLGAKVFIAPQQLHRALQDGRLDGLRAQFIFEMAGMQLGL